MQLVRNHTISVLTYMYPPIFHEFPASAAFKAGFYPHTPKAHV